jgi:hypothetical protein
VIPSEDFRFPSLVLLQFLQKKRINFVDKLKQVKVVPDGNHIFGTCKRYQRVNSYLTLGIEIEGV